LTKSRAVPDKLDSLTIPHIFEKKEKREKKKGGGGEREFENLSDHFCLLFRSPHREKGGKKGGRGEEEKRYMRPFNIRQSCL